MGQEVKRGDFFHGNHPVDQWVVSSLKRTQNRIDHALSEYEKPEMTLYSVEFNIRQSIAALREVRKSLLHGGYYE